MIVRTAGVLCVSLWGCLAMEAAQVNYTNLLPSSASPFFVSKDSSGNIYVAGTTGEFVGVFVAKVASDGTTLLYNTSVGALAVAGQAAGLRGLAVSPDGFAYVANYFQGSPAGCCPATSITKLDPSGRILFSGPVAALNAGLFSPTVADSIQAMATDAAGNLYLTGSFGHSSSSPGALNNPLGTGFIYKLDPNLNTVWTIAGYGGSRIAVDDNGDAFVAGATTGNIVTTPNAFQTSYPGLDVAPGTECGSLSNFGVPCAHQYVTAVDKGGGKLVYSTYLTGQFNDVVAGIVVDAEGTVFVAGSTFSFDFPTTSGVIEPRYPGPPPNTQAPSSSSPIKYGPGFGPAGPSFTAPTTSYVAALNPAGTGLVFSTFFGGSGIDLITAMALDPVYQTIDVGGSATSPDLPGLAVADRKCVPQSFIARLSLDGTAVKRTVLVPGLTVFATAAGNTAFFANGAVSGTADFEASESPISCLVDSLGLLITNAVTPGQLLTIFGSQLSASTLGVSPENNQFPTVAGGVGITVGGIPAPLLYVSPDQINLQVPFEIAGQSQVTLQFAAGNAEEFPVSDSRVLSVTAFTPTLLQVVDETGDCRGSYLGHTGAFVINADGSRNSCANPAKLNSTVTIFLGGLGTLAGSGPTGSVNSAQSNPLALPIAFNEYLAQAVPSVISANPAPGAVSGLYQIQIALPASAVNGFVGAIVEVNGVNAESVIAIPAAP